MRSDCWCARVTRRDMQAQFVGTPDAFAALTRLVAQYRAEHRADPVGLELEARIGRVASGTGVSAEEIDRMTKFVQTNPLLTVREWTQHTDYFLDWDGREHRYRTTGDGDTLRLTTEVTRKVRLGACTLHSGNAAVRFALSREVPVDVATLPDTLAPKHVRITHRKAFEFASRGFVARPTWRIDFGIVWSGDTKLEAETRQREYHVSQYTAELELLDPAYVVQHDDAYVACSLAMKVSDLFEREAHFVRA